MAKIRTKAVAGAIVLGLVAAGVLLKLIFFPSVSEDYFALNERNLQQVRAGLVVVRPTRFSRSHFNGMVSTMVRSSGKPVQWLMGRNVTFKDLLSTAYEQNVDRVALPADAPNTNFDFLITVRSNPQKKLQEAVRKKLGFVASMEPHDAEVLAVKVKNADLPGLAVSNGDQKQGVQFKDGKLCFSHVRLSAMTGGLEQVLRKPVVDKTGLNNFYDFSMAWSVEVQSQLQNAATARVVVDRILDDLGLALSPDTAPVQMLVIKKAN